MDIDAELFPSVAGESISKAIGRMDEQSTLDVIPHIGDILSNSIFMGIEKIAHTNNKGSAIYGYRLYNLYWYQDSDKKTPNCLVCTVVQDLDKAEGYVFQNIENVTVRHGLPGNNAGMPTPSDGNTYTVSQLYQTVKGIGRFDGGLKYSDNERKNHLIIGYTPEVFTALGMPSLPFTIGTGHVYSAAKTETEAKRDGNYRKGTHYHGLGASAIKNIYDSLKDPVAIIASKDVSKNATPMRSTHSVVAIVDIGNGQKSLLLPVEITAERSIDGVRMDVNTLSSAYERNVAELMNEAIALENTGDIGVYYAKKEAMTLPGAGVQFPIQLQRSIASNGIVHRFGDKVNMNVADATQSQQFKRWFGDWQNQPEKASKVVNPDGTPKIMYHGTRNENGEFYVFDETKAVRKGAFGLKAMGKGNYFTAVKLTGKERYGSRVIPAYLSIKNPFVYQGGSSFREQIRDELGIDTAVSMDQAQAEMRKLGYDGVIQYGSDGDVAIAVAFDSNQIKSAAENIGTFDGGNPDIRYSFGGTKAQKANLQKLERAKELDGQGVSMETIFRETGWYTGADGKWRFEIDDSGAKYRPGGDARFRRDHPEYARFRELEGKFIDATITEEEITELAALRSIWGSEPGRLAERVARGNAILSQVLEHEALYEQYPQLQRVKVRFGDTDDAGGWWDRERNEIVLSERYRRADPAFLELKLLHEIQHAIQDTEGFANGSNPEYWEGIQKGSEPIRRHDRKLERAYREAEEALSRVPPGVQKDFWYAANMTGQDPEEAFRLGDELAEGEYADAFDDYSWAIWTIQELEEDNPVRSPRELYRSTAGEIEARDTANRRSLSAEERKKRLPDTGGEDTVFVEGDTLSALLVGETKDGIEVYETSEDVMNLPWKERKQRFLRLMRDQYRGRTAKFVKNGQTYYARFEYRDVSKNIFGDKDSDDKGRDAKIKVGADGSIFELVENSRYIGSEPERGKNTKSHRGVTEWDYFVKTVQVDGVVCDLTANVRQKPDGEFVYAIEMHENKEIEPSSPGGSQNSGLDGMPNSSIISIQDNGGDVKRYSIQEDAEEDEEGGGFTRGWYADDEAARAAHLEGYPVINGVQVVPMKTWVRNTSIMTDKRGQPLLDKQGNPRRWNNYGLVAGLGSKPGTLSVTRGVQPTEKHRVESKENRIEC